MAIDLEHVPVLEEVGGYMTVKAAAKRLQSRDQVIYYLLRSGRIKGAKLDGYVWLVSKPSLERYRARMLARNHEEDTE